MVTDLKWIFDLCGLFNMGRYREITACVPKNKWNLSTAKSRIEGVEKYLQGLLCLTYSFRDKVTRVQGT